MAENTTEDTTPENIEAIPENIPEVLEVKVFDQHMNIAYCLTTREEADTGAVKIHTSHGMFVSEDIDGNVLQTIRVPESLFVEVTYKKA